MYELFRRQKNLAFLLVTSFTVRFLFLVLGIERVRTGFSPPISGAWEDYIYAYIPMVQTFKSGNLPYRDFFHAYPPLFLYVLTLFSSLPYFWSMALPLAISDALTIIPAYLIGKRFLKERDAFIASLLFALAPINLFYVDFMWLNPPLTTLFLLTSVYLLLKNHHNLSAITLAISIGFKQTSLLVLPIMLFFVAKKCSRQHLLKYLLIILSICFAFSLPYLFLEPKRYLFSIFRVPIDAWGELPENYFQLGFTNPLGGGQMDTATLSWYMLKWLKYGLTAPTNLALPLFVFLIPENFSGLYSMAYSTLTLILLVAYGALLYMIHRRGEIQDEALIKYVLYGLLFLFTFNPVYKYYVAGITPFLALLSWNRKDLIIFEAFNIALLIIPRILTSYLLLILLGWLLRPQLDRIMKTIRKSQFPITSMTFML